LVIGFSPIDTLGFFVFTASYILASRSLSPPKEKLLIAFAAGVPLESYEFVSPETLTF